MNCIKVYKKDKIVIKEKNKQTTHSLSKTWAHKKTVQQWFMKEIVIDAVQQVTLLSMLDMSCQLTPYKLEKLIYIRLLRNTLIKTLITKEVRIPIMQSAF